MGTSQSEHITSPQHWEQLLIENYKDYRWRRLMEPLCQKMDQWKKGQLPYDEMEQMLEDIYREVYEMRNLFSQREDRLVLLIQWWDRQWFEQWVREHIPPPGSRVLPDMR